MSTARAHASLGPVSVPASILMRGSSCYADDEVARYFNTGMDEQDQEMHDAMRILLTPDDDKLSSFAKLLPLPITSPAQGWLSVAPTRRVTPVAVGQRAASSSLCLAMKTLSSCSQDRSHRRTTVAVHVFPGGQANSHIAEERTKMTTLLLAALDLVDALTSISFLSLSVLLRAHILRALVLLARASSLHADPISSSARPMMRLGLFKPYVNTTQSQPRRLRLLRHQARRVHPATRHSLSHPGLRCSQGARQCEHAANDPLTLLTACDPCLRRAHITPRRARTTHRRPWTTATPLTSRDYASGYSLPFHPSSRLHQPPTSLHYTSD
ncbi:hypothetical protein K438DRAFT_1989072 [Mycena galopus ATCC 62051]|nr:hypothetical protein K438DRAFT_1989072 [Mycena galopus ATCC 62051]